MNGPRSLVTGACGFIGSHMVEELVAAGHEVIATDLPSACEKADRLAGRYPQVVRDLGVRIFPADIRDRRQLEALICDLDYLFHVASVFNYSASWELYRSVNVEGTRNLLELLPGRCSRLKRVVVWGAGGVYGVPSYHEGSLREDMPPAPPNDYQRAKWFQEHLTMEFCREQGISWTILRPTTVYGPRLVYGFGRLLMMNARSATVVVPASLTGHIPLVHVRDVTGSALHLSSSPLGEGIFNISDDTIITSVELLRMIAELAGRRFFAVPGIPLSWIKAGALGLATASGALARLIPGFRPLLERPLVELLDADFHYDNSRLKSTGYELRYPDARLGIMETLAWYQGQGWI